MGQFPIILNDATTGYKLQGSSKNQIILQTIDYMEQVDGYIQHCPGFDV